jgi:hypothetical protein
MTSDVAGDAVVLSAILAARLKARSHRRFLPGRRLLLQRPAERVRLPLVAAGLPIADRDTPGNESDAAQAVHHSGSFSLRRRRSMARVRIWLMRDSVTPSSSPISFKNSCS